MKLEIYIKVAEIGDIVQLYCSKLYNNQRIVISIDDYPLYKEIIFDDLASGGNKITLNRNNDIEVVIVKKNNQFKNKSMNIKEKFLTSLKKEPKKSFRKAEITNGDDMLTEDGKVIFLSWLLNKHGEEFKKEVVDELVEEMKKEEKQFIENCLLNKAGMSKLFTNKYE